MGSAWAAFTRCFQNKNLLAAWPSSPEYQPDFGPQHVMKGASINADATSEYLGVGYIIGPKVAGVIFAGGVFSWLVVMPLIYFFGKELGHPIYPAGAHRADGAKRPMGRLHQADGRGRGGCCRPDHADQNAADHL